MRSLWIWPFAGPPTRPCSLPAIAHELGLYPAPFPLNNDLNRKIPTLLSIQPSGPHNILDLYAAGGIPAVMKVLADDLHLEGPDGYGDRLLQRS